MAKIVSGEKVLKHAYTEQHPEVYVLDSSEEITGATTQSDCCHPAYIISNYIYIIKKHLI